MDTPDWSISKFYQKSWNMVKKQPILWLFGLASVLYSGSFSSSFNSRSSGSDQDSPTQEKKSTALPNAFSIVQQMIPSIDSATKPEAVVLGVDSESKSDSVPIRDETFDRIGKQLGRVSPTIYLLLIPEVVVLLIIGVFTGVVAKSWADASLYKAFEYLHKGETTISHISTQSVAYIKPVFKYNIYSSIVIGLTFFAVIVGAIILSIVVGIVAKLAGVIGGLIGGVAAFCAICYLIYLFIKKVVAVHWGKIFLLYENTGAKLGLEYGSVLNQVKGTTRKTIKLMGINVICSLLVGVLSFLPLIILVGAPVIVMITAGKFIPLSIPFFVIAVVIGFPFMMLVQSVGRAFFTGTWFFAYPYMNHLRLSHQEKTT